MGSRSVRDDTGHRAYRGHQVALKRRTKAQGLPCGHGSPLGWGGGEHIDTDLRSTHRMSFTADHDKAMANGDRPFGQALVPMHRRCNSFKSDHADTEIWAAS